MNKLGVAERARIIGALVEGNSVRSTCRMTGAAKGTVLKLLADIGKACAEYHDRTMWNLNSKRVQCDEIWAFCYAKAKNVPEELRGKPGFGDVWTWTAIDADSKLAVSWLVGDRSLADATAFMKDLSARLSNRVQLTTDGYGQYLRAVVKAFGDNVDYAQLEKWYAQLPEATGPRRYSPMQCCGAKRKPKLGNPDQAHISTSYVERQNLNMRMCMRRFTRLTNAFSKKVANLRANVALHFVWYNFGRVHQTLRVTPAMQAGVADHVWTVEEIAGLLP
jgi:IS1 family transposase